MIYRDAKPEMMPILHWPKIRKAGTTEKADLLPRILTDFIKWQGKPERS